MSRSAGEDAALVAKVADYVKSYMAQYDGSHDYSHIQRVLGLARHISAASPHAMYDELVITLAALLHDVGDKKYLKEGEDASSLVQKVLLGFGVEAELAGKIQVIVAGVSYSAEIQDPERVRGLVECYPELAVVQDADRLDAIGAVGIGRAFTYGGARGGAGRGGGMEETLRHFGDKLERLEGMMKTGEGRKLARERTQRLILFREWWAEEAEMATQGRALLEAGPR